MRSSILPSVAYCYCFLLLVQVLAELRQLHVVTRHGARLPLVKISENLTETTDGVLTPTGELQHYQLGLWIKEKFGGSSTLFQTYKASNVRLQSSSFDRTIISANALALGLFDETSRDPLGEKKIPENVTRPNVPVYTTEVKNDITIRAYDKCENYFNRLEQLYESDEWTTIGSQHRDLLYKLATFPLFYQYKDKDNKIPMEELWNVYDAIKVAQTECIDENSSTCLALPDPSVKDILTSTEWEELQEVTHIAEWMKYSGDTAGNLLGINLLEEIAQKMLDGLEKNQSQFFLYSAHYPTILSLFATLGVEPVSKVIPAYASALLFVLETTDSNSDIVKISYKFGDVNESVPISWKTCNSGSNCETLTEFASKFILEDFDWCKECNSTAGVCPVSSTNASTTTNTASTDDKSINIGALVGTLVGFFAGLIVSLVFIFYSRRNSVAKSQPSPVIPEDKDLEVEASSIN